MSNNYYYCPHLGLFRTNNIEVLNWTYEKLQKGTQDIFHALSNTGRLKIFFVQFFLHTEEMTFFKNEVSVYRHVYNARLHVI